VPVRESGLDLFALAALNSDASRAQITRPAPSTPVNISNSWFEGWEMRERNTLGLISHLDFFTATLPDFISQIDAAQSESLNQIVLFMAKTVNNLSVSAASNLAEMIRARRISLLSRSSLLTESSKIRLLTAPLTSQDIFRGLIPSVLSQDKDDQILASVVGRAPRTDKKPFKRPAYSPSQKPAITKKKKITPSAKGQSSKPFSNQPQRGDFSKGQSSSYNRPSTTNKAPPRPQP
jgi:hypothetical protein